MSDAFERLHDQLQAAMREQAPRRGWRRRGALLGLAVGMTVTGVAVAATQIVDRGQSPETQGRKIALRAVRDTATLTACRQSSDRGTLVDEELLPQLTAGLEILRRPADPPHALGRLGSIGSRVIRSSIHAVDAGGGIRLLIFVEAGGSGRTADPAACKQARRQRAEQLLEGRSAATRDWAARRLEELRDTAPGLQTLNIFSRGTGARSTGGVGIPVLPWEPVPRGLVGSGRVYTGIAEPRAARLELILRTAAKPRTVRVVYGLYAFALPRGTGRVSVGEQDVHGRRYT